MSHGNLVKSSLFAVSLALFSQTALSRSVDNAMEDFKQCVSLGLEGTSFDPQVVVQASMENIHKGSYTPPKGLTEKTQKAVKYCIDEYKEVSDKKGKAEKIKQEHLKTRVWGSVGELKRNGGNITYKDGTKVANVENPLDFKYVGQVGEVYKEKRLEGTVDQYTVSEWGSQLFSDGHKFYRPYTTYDYKIKQEKKGMIVSNKKIIIRVISGPNNLLKDKNMFSVGDSEFLSGLSLHPSGFFTSDNNGNIVSVPLNFNLTEVKICTASGESDYCNDIVVGGKYYSLKNGKLIKGSPSWKTSGVSRPDNSYFKHYHIYYRESLKNNNKGIASDEWHLTSDAISYGN